MTNKIKISITKPCGENWETMTLSEKGRFCASCQKNIIDFTSFSDREILKYYNQNSKVCGRFTTEQLNRNLVLPKEKGSIWMIASSSIIAFLGLGNQISRAQEAIKMEQTDKDTTRLTSTTDCDNEEIEIKGKIFLGETNPNFEEVEILIYGKNQMFHPNSDGKFCIKANKNDTLLIKKTGYDDFQMKVFKSINLGAIELELDRRKKSYILGGSIALKRSFWYRLFH